jgi:hypothetical protein
MLGEIKLKNRNKIIYDEKIYAGVGLENLVLYGIYLVSKKKEICTFEKLVAECFSQFPKVFAFKRYPEWPDSLKFDRPLRKLREKGMIVGIIKDSFSLTKFGEQKAIETEDILKKINMGFYKKRKDSQERSVEDRLITYIKDSESFKKYINNPSNFTISEPEFRKLLRCTLETPLRVIKQNLEYYKKLANSYKEEELFNFLLSCEKQFIGR